MDVTSVHDENGKKGKKRPVVTHPKLERDFFLLFFDFWFLIRNGDFCGRRQVRESAGRADRCHHLVRAIEQSRNGSRRLTKKIWFSMKSKKDGSFFFSGFGKLLSPTIQQKVSRLFVMATNCSASFSKCRLDNFFASNERKNRSKMSRQKNRRETKIGLEPVRSKRSLRASKQHWTWSSTVTLQGEHVFQRGEKH